MIQAAELPVQSISDLGSTNGLVWAHAIGVRMGLCWKARRQGWGPLAGLGETISGYLDQSKYLPPEDYSE